MAQLTTTQPIKKLTTKEVYDVITPLDFKEKASTLETYHAYLDADPNPKIVYDHPYAKGVKYIPIGIIETMLNMLFQVWYIEVRETKQLFNSIQVTVRLHYKHPVLQQMMYFDGIGACAVQVDAGKNASDLGAIKANAVMLAAPMAKSYAIKDAAEHLGARFGRDLNRTKTMEFMELREKPPVVDVEKLRISNMISGATSEQQLLEIENTLISANQLTDDYKLLLIERRQNLK